MKVLAILILCHFAICNSHDDAIQECSKGTKDPHAFDKAVKAFTSGNFVGLDEETKCVYRCILVKKGYMTEAGALNLLEAKERFAKAAELTGKCNSAKGKTPCETAFEAAKCLHDVYKVLHP